MPAQNTSGYMYKSKSCARLAARGVWRCCAWRCTHFPRAVHRVCRTCRPEVSTRDSTEHKARTGITKYMPRGPVLPAWTPAMVGVHAATAAIVAAFLATTRARRPTLDPWHTPGIHPCAINHATSSCRGRAAQQQRNATDLARCKIQEPALFRVYLSRF